DLHLVLDDVDDLVHRKAHAAVMVGEHDHRLAALLAHAAAVHDGERHELFAILDHWHIVGEFDALHGDFLKPRNERQRHGAGRPATGAEHQHGLALAVHMHGAHLRIGLALIVAHHVGGLGRDAVGIEDHDHAAVAKDRIAGIDGEITQDGRHR